MLRDNAPEFAEVRPRILNVRVIYVPPAKASYVGPLKTCHVRIQSSGVLMTCEGRNTRVMPVSESECLWDMGNTCSKVSDPPRRRATSKCDEVDMKEVNTPRGPCNTWLPSSQMLNDDSLSKTHLREQRRYDVESLECLDIQNDGRIFVFKTLRRND